MLYTIYKTINMLNKKEYVGFHKIPSIYNIKYEISENGSIFEDGYLGSGKLMKRALEKYGPMNMKQELVFVTDDKDEAEALEKEIVCYEWVKSDKNYNISIGGNVTILFGEDNGFYGKKHIPETIEKILKSRKETYDKTPFSWSKSYLVEDESVTFLNSDEVKKYFNIEKDWFLVNKLVYEGIIRYECKYLQKAAIQRYLKRYNFLNDVEARNAAKEKLAILAKIRFSGVPKTPESNLKRSKSIKSWIDENPIEHQERMLKINKNPEKIRKTAEKHRGMKRSEETKKKMSEKKKGLSSHNKGKIYIHNPETKQRKYIDKEEIIPSGWIKGIGSKK